VSKKLGSMFGLHPDAEKKPDPRLAIPLGKIGIEVEVENCKKFPKLQFWEGKKDDSLREGGWEWITKGPVYGANIRDAIEELFAESKKGNWSDGYPRAGIHIHLDVRDLDFESLELSRLISNYMIVEHAMFSYAGEWRRNTQYCEALEDGQYDFRTLGKFLFSPPDSKEMLQDYAEMLSKYQAVNLRPLIDLGTIEFRQLPTKFDVEWLFDWIRVILALKKSAMDKDIVDPLHALSNMGPEAYVRKILGDTYPVLGKYIQNRRIWAAVDNATALMAYGNKFASKEQAVGWDAPAAAPNPIVEELVAQAARKKEKETADKLAKKPTSISEVAQRFYGLDEAIPLDEPAMQFDQLVAVARANPPEIRGVNPVNPLLRRPPPRAEQPIRPPRLGAIQPRRNRP